MSDYYITSNETKLSISRINRVTANHPSASLNFSTTLLDGTVTGTNLNPNSKISELADKSYKYLFSQKITSLTRRPIKFSDFRNNVFFATDVSVKPETPAAYGEADDGGVVIKPFGGTGQVFNVKFSIQISFGEIIISDSTFLSGENLTISGLNVESQYIADITNLDDNLNVINSYRIYITIPLGGYRYYAGHQRYAYGSTDPQNRTITTTHYFSRL